MDALHVMTEAAVPGILRPSLESMFTDALAWRLSKGLVRGRSPVRKLPTMRRGMCHWFLHAEKTANVSSDRDDEELNEKPGGWCSSIVAAAALELIGLYRESVSPSKRTREGPRE